MVAEFHATGSDGHPRFVRRTAATTPPLCSRPPAAGLHRGAALVGGGRQRIDRHRRRTAPPGDIVLLHFRPGLVLRLYTVLTQIQAAGSVPSLSDYLDSAPPAPPCRARHRTRLAHGPPDPSELLTRVIGRWTPARTVTSNQMVGAVDRAFRPARTWRSGGRPVSASPSPTCCRRSRRPGPMPTPAPSWSPRPRPSRTSSANGTCRFLADALDVPFRFAVLKGRSNYLCQAAVAETRVQLGRGEEQQTLGSGRRLGRRRVGPGGSGPDPLLRREPRPPPPVGRHHSPPVSWQSLADPPSDPAWSALSGRPRRVRRSEPLRLRRASASPNRHERAGGADIVVVNAHLYAADVQAGGQLLPVHDHLVIDGRTSSGRDGRRARRLDDRLADPSDWPRSTTAAWPTPRPSPWRSARPPTPSTTPGAGLRRGRATVGQPAHRVSCPT